MNKSYPSKVAVPDSMKFLAARDLKNKRENPFFKGICKTTLIADCLNKNFGGQSSMPITIKLLLWQNALAFGHSLFFWTGQFVH